MRAQEVRQRLALLHIFGGGTARVVKARRDALELLQQFCLLCSCGRWQRDDLFAAPHHGLRIAPGICL
jgi:hypothetical protein